MPVHFSPAAIKFLRDLKRHNDRDWFNARKHVYEAELKAPMLALIAEINDALASFAPDFVRDPAKIMMRIYRDTRFSKNKLPYKTNLAAWWARHGMEKTSGGGFYLAISPDEITVAAGCYMPAPEQLLAIRRHLQTHHATMRSLLADRILRAAGMSAVEDAALSRPPKGFSADDPAIDLIKHKQWGIAARLPPETAQSASLSKEIVKRFKLSAPLVALLNRAPDAAISQSLPLVHSGPAVCLDTKINVPLSHSLARLKRDCVFTEAGFFSARAPGTPAKVRHPTTNGPLSRTTQQGKRRSRSDLQAPHVPLDLRAKLGCSN